MVAAGNLIRATDTNDLIKIYYAFSTAGNTFGAGSARQDIAGLTFAVTTVNPNAEVAVTFCVDCTITTTQAGQSYQFRLEVDGVAQQGFASWPTATAARGTPSNCVRVTHPTPGTFTYQVTGITGGATAAATCVAGISNMIAIAKDLAA
jgi:hypothetical protein